MSPVQLYAFLVRLNRFSRLQRVTDWNPLCKQVYLCDSAIVDKMSAVHINPWSKLPTEGLVQKGFFEVVEGGEFLAVDGFEAAAFSFDTSQCFDMS